MNDDALKQVMEDLERQIGPERMSAIRRKAASENTSVIKLLGDAVRDYSDALNAPSSPSKAA